MIRSILSAVLLAAVVAAPLPAVAWEGQTTQAGLAEQAALASSLQTKLIALGFSRGWYEPLTIPPADAPGLTAALGLLSPSQGVVPDLRGRQSALAWIAAGAVLGELPSAAVNQFLDPSTGKGLADSDDPNDAGCICQLIGDINALLLGVAGIEAPIARGISAPEWVVAKDNPLGFSGFQDQYIKAIRATTPGERSRHLAGALVAAGAMLAALGDMGSPARVRNDLRAFNDPLSHAPGDLGSRFERIAALAFGRAGVPAPSRVITRNVLRDFYTNAAHDGLADVTATHWFSEYTLPHDFSTYASKGDAAHASLARPLPALPARLNLMAATGADGATLHDAAGVCLARYRAQHGNVSFFLDDACRLEQVANILPLVASYQAGLLEYLFRDSLAVTLTDNVIEVRGSGLGIGTIEILREDDHGNRTTVSTTTIPGSKDGNPALAHSDLTLAAVRVVALFRGTDDHGQPLVASGAIDLRPKTRDTAASDSSTDSTSTTKPTMSLPGSALPPATKP